MLRGTGLLHVCLQSLGRLNMQLLMCWAALLFIVYCYLIREGQVLQLSEFYSPQPLISTSTASTATVTSIHNHVVDAIVFISMGRTMSSNPMTDYTIASARLLGRWSGDIFVLTDCPDCFSDAEKQYGAKIVNVPTAKSLMHIKALKANMFTHLPSSVNGVLYLDVDIVVMKNLESFLRDIAKLVAKRVLARGVLHPLSNGKDTRDGSDVSGDNLNEFLSLAAFPDAKGHYVGFCSGCEKWHTGVLVVRRNSSKNPSPCLSSWEQIVLSGEFDTDQESLDTAERRGQCTNILELPSKHLLFAKDYIGMALTSGQTFIHLTGAGHMEDQDYFYREIIVPRIYSLNSPLNLPTKPKNCKNILPSKLTGNIKGENAGQRREEEEPPIKKSSNSMGTLNSVKRSSKSSFGREKNEDK